MTYVFIAMLLNVSARATEAASHSCDGVLAPRGGFHGLHPRLQEEIDRVWRASADASPNPIVRWARTSVDSWVLENELDLISFVSAQRMAGLDLDARDERGRTALMHAVINRKHQLTWALLRNGARVDLRDDAGRTAADHAEAAYANDRTELRYIEKYLTIDGRYVGDEVWAATRSADPSALEDLLKRGLFVDFFDLNLGQSLLTKAAVRGDLAQMRLLLKYGADPRFRMRNGDGPVYPVPAAAAECQIEAVALLLEHGASIDDGGSYMYELNPVIHAIYEYANGRTPVRDHLGMLEWLLAHGADPDANFADSPIRNKLNAAQMIEEIHGRKPESKAQIVALFRKYGKLPRVTVH